MTTDRSMSGRTGAPVSIRSPRSAIRGPSAILLIAGFGLAGACGTDEKEPPTEGALPPTFTATCADPGDPLEINVSEKVGKCDDSPTVLFEGASAEGTVTRRNPASGSAPSSVDVRVTVPATARSGTIQVDCGSFVTGESTRTLLIPCGGGTGGTNGEAGEAGNPGRAGSSGSGTSGGGGRSGGSSAGGTDNSGGSPDTGGTESAGGASGGETSGGSGGEGGANEAGSGQGGVGTGGTGGSSVPEGSSDLDPDDAEDLRGVLTVSRSGKQIPMQFYGYAASAQGDAVAGEYEFYVGEYVRPDTVAPGGCGRFENVLSTPGPGYVSFGTPIELRDGNTVVDTLDLIPQVNFYTGALPGNTPSTPLDIFIPGSQDFGVVTLPNGLVILTSPLLAPIEPPPVLNVGEPLVLDSTPVPGYTHAVIVIPGPNDHIICYPRPDWEQYSVPWAELDSVLEGDGTRYGDAYIHWMRYEGFRPTQAEFLMSIFEAYGFQSFELAPPPPP